MFFVNQCKYSVKNYGVKFLIAISLLKEDWLLNTG